MRRIVGCKCCGKKCKCVKLSGFSAEEWKFIRDFHPIYGNQGDTEFLPNTSRAYTESVGNNGDLTVWDEEEEGVSVIKVRLHGTFHVAGTSGYEPYLFGAWIDTALDNAIWKWPTKFAICYMAKGSEENSWTKTRTTGPSISSPTFNVESQPVIVRVKHPESYINPSYPFGSPVQEWNDVVDDYREGVAVYGSPSSIPSLRDGYSSFKNEIDRSNGELYETAFPNGSRFPWSDYTLSDYPNSWEDKLNWPLRFGFLLRWKLEKGYNHEIDTTITIRSLRVGFPERVNFSCIGHLVEGDEILQWEGVYHFLRNDNYEGTEIFPSTPAVWMPKVTIADADDYAALGTPDSNPSDWGGVSQFFDFSEDRLGSLQGDSFYSGSELGSYQICHTEQYLASGTAGYWWEHKYREDCDDSGDYVQRWITNLYWKNSSNVSYLIQVWELNDPDMGVWNVMTPVEGYSEWLTEEERENLILTIAFYKGGESPSPGSSTPLFPGWSRYFLNNTTGYPS